MDLFEGLPEEDLVPPGESLVQSLKQIDGAKLTRAEKAECTLDGIADQLYEESLDVIGDAMRFADVEPEALAPGEPPPEKWVRQVGYERATRRQRVARSAWMPKKDAPAGLFIAQTMASSIAAAKAKSREGPSTLNVAFVTIAVPEQYEVIDVEK